MMKAKLTFILFVAYLIFPNILSAKGAEVEINLYDGKIIYGELLFVRDSSVLIETIKEVSENIFPELEEKVIVINNIDIRRIIILGKSFVFSGALIGALLGGSAIAIGDQIGNSSGSSEGGLIKGYAVSVLGSISLIIGAGIGAIVGSLLSSDDIIIEPYPNLKWKLKPYARYPDEEPEFLKEHK